MRKNSCVPLSFSFGEPPLLPSCSVGKEEIHASREVSTRIGVAAATTSATPRASSRGRGL
jgi:hypothetical protein